jgi:hypothetical protein
MTLPTEQGATSEPSAPREPGKRDGQASELTVIAPLKAGGAEMVRELIRRSRSNEAARGQRDGVGTLHELRVVLIDNDTRMLFATVFDGTWDSYINDFASKMPDQLDALFGAIEGYPGIHDPNVKNFIRKYQIEAEDFYSAYPDTTVHQIKKGQRVLQAWEALLDASEE